MTAPDFRYLNLELRWPAFRLQGIEIGAAGELTLARVPALAPVAGAPIPPVPGLAGAVGVGVSPCGDVYVADPAGHRVLRVDGCDGTVSPVPCFGGRGDAPGRLQTPRGVAVAPTAAGDALLVADSGNRRVQVVDLATGQLRGVWGAPGQFADPWDLAVDARGDVYVADAGTTAADGTRSGGTVHKLNARGRPIAAFAATLAAQSTRPVSPIGVTVAALDGAAGARGAERLLVLDSAPPALLVYGLDGAFDAETTARWGRVVGGSGDPVAVAAAAGRLYVADAATGRVLVFDGEGRFLGVASGTGASVAGIALDCRGRLVVHPGGGGSVQMAGGAAAYAPCGTFLAGPFEGTHTPTRWWQLRATLDALPPMAHLRLYTLTSDGFDGVAGNEPPAPVACAPPDPVAAQPPDTVAATPLDEWRAAPWDAPDLLTLNAPGRYLWVAGVMEGDGTASPVVRQMRVDFDVDDWMRHLPAIFSRNAPSRTFLERTLALLAVPFAEEAQRIDDVARLIDPAAAPDALPQAGWLDWLGGWVSAELEETWGDAARRRAVAGAFSLYARRGTKETIRALVAMHAGATPVITELFEGGGPWVLGGTPLGAETALAGAAPDGAILGGTAVVDHARLVEGDGYGAPAFADVAHRFSVRLYGAQLASPASADAVRRVLDREKPAHTTYHLCVIEPRLRVGVQAAVGVDAIVGGAAAGPAFDGTRALGVDAILPDESGGGGGRLPRAGLAVLA